MMANPNIAAPPHQKHPRDFCSYTTNKVDAYVASDWNGALDFPQYVRHFRAMIQEQEK